MPQPLPSPPPPARLERQARRVRHELRLRDLQVLQVAQPSPNFVRVTLGGDDLADFASDGFDDHVKLMFTGADGQTVRRDYTPRSFDRAARTLTIEFALHAGGVASDWARQARPGQRLAVGGPRGSMVFPDDHAWTLLVGDATALPALHRRLDELPAGSRAIAIVQLEDAADRRALRSRAALELHWVADAQALLDTVRALALPAGDGFVWCAGEAGTMARLRDLLVHEKQHPREALHVAAYWRRGDVGFHETLAA